MGSVALRYQTSIRALAQANGIRNPNRVHAGRLLTLPKHAKHPSVGATATAWLEDLALAKDLYRQARFSEARESAETLMASVPTDAMTLAALAFFQGTIEVAYGNVEAASNRFEEVYRHDPDFDAGHRQSPKIQALLAGARARRLALR